MIRREDCHADSICQSYDFWDVWQAVGFRNFCRAVRHCFTRFGEECVMHCAGRVDAQQTTCLGPLTCERVNRSIGYFHKITCANAKRLPIDHKFELAFQNKEALFLSGMMVWRRACSGRSLDFDDCVFVPGLRRERVKGQEIAEKVINARASLFHVEDSLY